jgi:hypothetical protein
LEQWARAAERAEIEARAMRQERERSADISLPTPSSPGGWASSSARSRRASRWAAR